MLHPIATAPDETIKISVPLCFNKAISDERLSSQTLLKSPFLSTRSADPTLMTTLLNIPNLLVFISKLI